MKQQAQVTYLGCVLDESMSGEPMALKVVNKINEKLKLLYRKNKFLTPELRRILCNALIQPHFDYPCTAWYSNLTEKTKKKIQIMQNNETNHRYYRHYDYLGLLLYYHYYYYYLQYYFTIIFNKLYIICNS